MLLKLNLGSYECGGRKMERDIWIDPTRIIGVRARTLGRQDSVLMIEGAEDIEVSMTPDDLIASLKRMTQ